MSKRKREQWHLYNFQCDDENSCAVTACLPNARVHVIADIAKLYISSELGRQFRNLIDQFKSQGDEKQAAQSKSNGSADKDSGVDVTDDDRQSTNDGALNGEQDAETALLSWILSPLLEDQQVGKPAKAKWINKSLQDWYRCTTHFYDLAVSSEDDRVLEAVELESTKELEKVVDSLLPSVTLPKNTTEKLNVPHYRASDLHVLQCSDQPPGTPYHPCRVRHRRTKRTYFFKVVDNSQPRTTKRELNVLGRITNLHLAEQMRVPELEGLVSFDDVTTTESGRRKIMGFLQGEISNPTPLTNLLDPSIPQAKRERWAEEAEHMKAILHENNIIWGDAKADNFMVDDNDNLWIIDFGGSYTEGWVDPELKETKEGDDQGTNKTIYALHDPEACTRDSDEGKKHTRTSKQGSRSGRKRKANNGSGADIHQEDSDKRRRSARLKK